MLVRPTKLGYPKCNFAGDYEWWGQAGPIGVWFAAIHRPLSNINYQSFGEG